MAETVRNFLRGRPIRYPAAIGRENDVRRILIGLAAAALLTTYGQAQEAAPTVHQAMKDVVAPQVQVIWDVSNNAMDDDGNPDASKVSAAQWQQIVEAAERVRDMSLSLALATPVVVAGPSVALQDEGNPEASTPAQIQAFIDADPAGFADHARKLATSAAELLAAAHAKDAAKMGDIANGIDQVCEECHTRFWYPQQAAAVEG